MLCRVSPMRSVSHMICSTSETIITPSTGSLSQTRHKSPPGRCDPVMLSIFGSIPLCHTSRLPSEGDCASISRHTFTSTDQQTYHITVAFISTASSIHYQEYSITHSCKQDVARIETDAAAHTAAAASTVTSITSNRPIA